MKWIYIVLVILTTEVATPCPEGRLGCAVYHSETVRDTTVRYFINAERAKKYAGKTRINFDWWIATPELIVVDSIKLKR